MRKASRLFTAGLFVVTLLVVAAPAQGASGAWERAWGKDVDSVAVGTGPEICVIAANCKVAANPAVLGGEFDFASNVAADAAGNVYVTDESAHRVQKFDSNGNFLRLWGKDVTSAGPNQTGTGFEICVAAQGDTCKIGVAGGLGGEMNGPDGIAVDSQGFVYVADSENDRIQRFDSSGVFSLAWGKDVVAAGSPSNTGTGFEICDPGLDVCKTGAEGGLGGEMTGPDGLALDGAGNLYVAESSGERIQKFAFNGSGVPQFVRLWGKDVDSVVVGTGPEICTVAADCKVAGTGTTLGGEFNDPVSLAVDGAGDVYVADTSYNRVQKFDPNGNFLRLWGKDVVVAGPGNTGTGAEICVAGVDTCKQGAATSGLGGEFSQPVGLAVDSTGAAYVSEFSGHRIQKFDSSGNFLRLWGQNVVSAGPGNTGTGFEICLAPVDTCKNGDNGSPSLGGQMVNPTGLGLGPTGDLYVAEATNDRVQKFAADPPPETTITAGPGAFATATPSFQFSSGDAGSTFECSIDAGPFAACTSPLTTAALGDGAHQLQVRATDPARQVDATPDSRAFTVDTVAPDTQIDSGPAAGSTIDDSTPSFGFSATEAGSSFQCRIDADPFAACNGPGAAHTTEALADGEHTFEVRATDPAGNADASPAARAFTVDAVPNLVPDSDPPETRIDKQPKRKSFKRKAKFGFSADEAGSTFECKLDKGQFASCGASAKFKVKPGRHRLEVRATDAAGNVDLTPAIFKWKVRRRK